MSIIYDSLKKVEKERVPEPPKSKNNPAKNLKLIAFYGIFSLMGAVTSVFAFNHFVKNAPVTKKNLAAAKSKTPKPYKAYTPPAPFKDMQTPAPPSLKIGAPLALNGIFFSGESGYALINNQIVKEGDSVEGAYVQKISEDEVVLKSNSGLMKLTTRAR